MSTICTCSVSVDIPHPVEKKTRQKKPDEFAASVVLHYAINVSIANNFDVPVSEGDSQITFKLLITQLILIPETV